MPPISSLTRQKVLPHARVGARPCMHRTLPHLQLDQFPPERETEELLQRCLEIPSVRSKESRMASPLSHALYLSDQYAVGPPEAFIDQNEFCHLHPLPEAGIHLTLPKVLREEVVRLAWGERHPIAESGLLTTLVTLYAPRDRQETEIVLGLVLQACHFAQGKLQALSGEEHSLRESV
jgi:hypothetical protein